MLLRSFSVAPSTVLILMCIPSPSGYCGAVSRTFQRGKKYTPIMRTAAARMSSRGVLPTLFDAAVDTPTSASLPMPGSGALSSFLTGTARRLATAICRLGSFVIVLRQRLRASRLRLCPLADVGLQCHRGSRRRNPDVSLHLLMQRRAEVGAVERIDAR